MSSPVKPNKLVTITAHTRPCTQLLDVPVALLTVMLQHVPFQERLGVCTRVCRSFYAAAVAATNSISTTSLSSQPKCDQLVEWLQGHGDGLTALKLAALQYGLMPCLASLPCPLLRDLDLYGLHLQPGFPSVCTGLTRLRLESCGVDDSPHASSSAAGNPQTQLSVLSSLQHLSLGIVRAGCSATNSAGTTLELPSFLLSQLVQLTYLQLRSTQVQSDAALQHLSALSALQHLDLNLYCWGLQRPSAAALTGLQHLKHLTAVRLSCVDINLHSLPAVTALTALRVLQLWDTTSVDAAVLAGFSQLQELDMRCSYPWDAEGSARVLAAVGQQAQLTRLALHTHSSWCPPSAAAYSALTASSCLQHLELHNGELPACAWQHTFPPKRCLPELRYLRVWANDLQAAQQLSPADMQAMVSCCPALGTLKLGPQLAVSTAAPLQQLTGLTDLSMSASFQDNAPSIARLTGLQILVLYAFEAGNQVTVSGLLQLTVLQRLQCICIEGSAFDPG